MDLTAKVETTVTITLVTVSKQKETNYFNERGIKLYISNTCIGRKSLV